MAIIFQFPTGEILEKTGIDAKQPETAEDLIKNHPEKAADLIRGFLLENTLLRNFIGTTYNQIVGSEDTSVESIKEVYESFLGISQSDDVE